MLVPFFKGFLTTAGLITAIGAQNIFVLKQGLMKSHVLLVVLMCCAIDTFLITIGVNGVGELIITIPHLQHITKYGGAAFLFCYGAKAFYEAYRGKMTMVIDESNKRRSVKSVVLILLAVSFLNPHTYLDTMVLIGSVGAHLDIEHRIVFIIGATLASLSWFTLLCCGARYLAPYFQKQSIWRLFNSFVGIVMWGIALTLIITE